MRCPLLMVFDICLRFCMISNGFHDFSWFRSYFFPPLRTPRRLPRRPRQRQKQCRPPPRRLPRHAGPGGGERDRLPRRPGQPHLGSCATPAPTATPPRALGAGMSGHRGPSARKRAGLRTALPALSTPSARSVHAARGPSARAERRLIGCSVRSVWSSRAFGPRLAGLLPALPALPGLRPALRGPSACFARVSRASGPRLAGRRPALPALRGPSARFACASQAFGTRPAGRKHAFARSQQTSNPLWPLSAGVRPAFPS